MRKGHRVLHADKEIRLNREDHSNQVASQAPSPLVQELGGRVSVRLRGMAL
jgi:hypothetical protein